MYFIHGRIFTSQWFTQMIPQVLQHRVWSKQPVRIWAFGQARRRGRDNDNETTLLYYCWTELYQRHTFRRLLNEHSWDEHEEQSGIASIIAHPFKCFTMIFLSLMLVFDHARNLPSTCSHSIILIYARQRMTFNQRQRENINISIHLFMSTIHHLWRLICSSFQSFQWTQTQRKPLTARSDSYKPRDCAICCLLNRQVCKCIFTCSSLALSKLNSNRLTKNTSSIQIGAQKLTVSLQSSFRC